VTYSFENGNLRKYADQNYSKVLYIDMLALVQKTKETKTRK